MKLWIYVSPKAAVLAGKTRSGVLSVEVTEEDLAGIAGEEREALASLPGLGDTPPGANVPNVLGCGYYLDGGGETRDVEIPDPTFGAALACLRARLSRQKLAAEAKVEETEKRRQEALVAADRYLGLVGGYLVICSTGSSPGNRFRAQPTPAGLDLIPADLAASVREHHAQATARAKELNAEEAAEALRRAEVERAAEQAAAEQHRQALRALVASHGTPSQQARLGAGLLPAREADAILYAVVFAPLKDCARHVKLDASDVEHTEECDDDAAVSFSSADATELDAEEWAALQTIERAMPDAAVSPRAHVATCDECGAQAVRHSARVAVAWHGRELVREYAL